MSSLLCMNIRGVRSFASDTEQRIEFFKPLTVIVGPNGCGKTSTIECTNPSQKPATSPNIPADPLFLVFLSPFFFVVLFRARLLVWTQSNFLVAQTPHTTPSTARVAKGLEPAFLDWRHPSHAEVSASRFGAIRLDLVVVRS